MKTTTLRRWQWKCRCDLGDLDRQWQRQQHVSSDGYVSVVWKTEIRSDNDDNVSGSIYVWVWCGRWLLPVTTTNLRCKRWMCGFDAGAGSRQLRRRRLLGGNGCVGVMWEGMKVWASVGGGGCLWWLPCECACGIIASHGDLGCAFCAWNWMPWRSKFVICTFTIKNSLFGQFYKRRLTKLEKYFKMMGQASLVEKPTTAQKI